MISVDSLDTDATKENAQKRAGNLQVTTKLFETGKVIGNGQKLVTNTKSSVPNSTTRT